MDVEAVSAAYAPINLEPTWPLAFPAGLDPPANLFSATRHDLLAQNTTGGYDLGSDQLTPSSFQEGYRLSPLWSGQSGGGVDESPLGGRAMLANQGGAEWGTGLGLA